MLSVNIERNAINVCKWIALDCLDLFVSHNLKLNYENRKINADT